jgi:hypothetical protein
LSVGTIANQSLIDPVVGEKLIRIVSVVDGGRRKIAIASFRIEKRWLKR